MVKYACEEHMDDAMEDIINEGETFPIINEAKDKQCSYCTNECKYEVKMI